MVVDEDSVCSAFINRCIANKRIPGVESDGKELVEKAIATQPDIIILNSVFSGKQ